MSQFPLALPDNRLQYVCLSFAQGIGNDLANYQNLIINFCELSVCSYKKYNTFIWAYLKNVPIFGGFVLIQLLGFPLQGQVLDGRFHFYSSAGLHQGEEIRFLPDQSFFYKVSSEGISHNSGSSYGHGTYKITRNRLVLTFQKVDQAPGKVHIETQLIPLGSDVREYQFLVQSHKWIEQMYIPAQGVNIQLKNASGNSIISAQTDKGGNARFELLSYGLPAYIELVGMGLANHQINIEDSHSKSFHVKFHPINLGETIKPGTKWEFPFVLFDASHAEIKVRKLRKLHRVQLRKIAHTGG